MTKEVTLTINVNPVSVAYVRNINFDLMVATKDEVLRREMRQMEGTWLDSRNVELSKECLNRLGFFETVDIRTTPHSGADALVDLTYDVKEQPSGSFTFGKLATESKLSLQLGLSQSNFMGTGNSVGINLDTNSYSKRVDLSVRDPYFTKHGVSASGRPYWSAFDADENLDSKNDSYGAAFDLSTHARAQPFRVGWLPSQ